MPGVRSTGQMLLGPVPLSDDTASSLRTNRIEDRRRACPAARVKNGTSGGRAADYLVRNKPARKVSKAEMLDNIRHSKENALVLNADNVRRNITYRTGARSRTRCSTTPRA